MVNISERKPKVQVQGHLRILAVHIPESPKTTAEAPTLKQMTARRLLISSNPSSYLLISETGEMFVGVKSVVLSVFSATVTFESPRMSSVSRISLKQKPMMKSPPMAAATLKTVVHVFAHRYRQHIFLFNFLLFCLTIIIQILF